MGREKTLTETNFQTEVLESQQPVLVDFWAEWCGPCRMLAPVIEKIAEANQGKVMVGKLNVDDHTAIAQRYGIQGIPTMILFRGGEVAAQLVGFQSQDKIQKVIDEALTA